MSAKTESMRSAASFRHGIVLPPQAVKRTPADIDGVVNLAIPAGSTEPWKTAAGGLGRTAAEAELAAIGEALERYSAAAFPLPERSRDDVGPVLDVADFSLYSDEQRRDASFPHGAVYADDVPYTNVFSLADNAEAWVPAAVVGLSAHAAVTTSSGLAAAASAQAALLRAVQELVERDALMVTWLHGVPGRRVDLPAAYRESVEALGGDAVCIDATPDYSPHPVALICGGLPLRGHQRYSLGAACRETWAAAVEKAYLEWIQGVVFAGYYVAHHRDLEFRDPRDARTFDDHAVYYTVNPEQWEKVPLLAGRTVERPDDVTTPKPPLESLERLGRALAQRGLRLYYRDLTTSDVRRLGLRVVRALSPDLAPIGCDERWPFLGGTVADVGLRYPWAVGLDLCFPNPYPHPLG